jgi:hypothetical protein
VPLRYIISNVMHTNKIKMVLVVAQPSRLERKAKLEAWATMHTN